MAKRGHVGEGGSRAEKARFWRRQLRSLARSGESQRGFCARNGLSHERLKYWKRKFAESTTGSMRLVEVPTPILRAAEDRAEATVTAVTVIVAQGYRVEVAAGFEATALSRVLDVLENRR
jgi:hypothetical protein